MNEASSDARKRAAWAISQALPIFPRNGTCSNAVFRVADGEGLGVGVDPRLRSLVGDDSRGTNGRDRRNIDDGARLLFAHGWKDSLAGEDDTLQVDSENVIPTRLFDVCRAGVGAADADIIMQNVDTSIGFEAVLHQSGAGRIAGGVCFDGHRRTPFAFDHVDGFLCGVETSVDGHDLRAFTGEEDRGGSTIPDRVTRCLSGPHHDRHFVLETKTHDFGNPWAPSSSWTPSVLSAIETRLY